MSKRHGYGRFYYHGKECNAHRVAYELAIAPVPSGLVVDHLCENRICVNPAHLEPVTHEVNLRRSASTVNAINSAKTHCLRGHPLTGDNVYIMKNGCRSCRRCNRERMRQRYRDSLGRPPTPGIGRPIKDA